MKQNKANSMGVLTTKRKPPKQVWGFDIETDVTNKASFVLGVFYGYEKGHVFNSSKDMIEHLKKHYPIGKHKPKIIATNLEYDINALLKNSEYDKYFIRNYHEGKLYTSCVYLDPKTREFINPNNKEERSLKKAVKIEFRDTTNYDPSSVEKIAKIIGMEKYKAPKALGKTPKNNEEYEELAAYCVQDAKISKKYYEFLEKTIYEFGGQLQSTIAKTSLDLFRRSYMKKTENWYLSTPEKDEVIRESYKGGRTEVFIRGLAKSTVYSYDFNSMYPYIMSILQLPHPNHLHNTTSSQRNINTYEGVSKVLIRPPKDIHKPILCTRATIDKEEKVVFPACEFEGVFCHNELRYALEHGYEILEYKECIISRRTHLPFKEFVEDLYKKRLYYKSIKSNMESVCKLLMNSLYGKFAQRCSDTKVFLHMDNGIELKEGDELFEGKAFINRTLKGTAKRRNFMHPILSSYITAEGRIMLHKKMMQAEQQGAKVYYCDTDSIMVDKEIICDPDKLGDVKLEKIMKNANFIRPKLYYYQEDEQLKLKAKGLQGQQRWYATEELIECIEEQKPIKQKRFVKWKSSLKSKDTHKFGILQPNEEIIIDKLIGLEDNKRVWSKAYNRNQEQNSKPIMHLN